MPSVDGSVEVTLPRWDDSDRFVVSDTTCLVGYSAVDNSMNDGVVLSYSCK